MTRAYNELYLDDAMRNLGEAFDYSVYGCNIQMDDFMDMFIAGGLAGQFESGVPRYVSGMSGTELACEVVRRSGRKCFLPAAQTEYDCSREYWCGWILAYYQWYSGRSFKSIHGHISMHEVLDLYPALHEASEDKFVEIIERRTTKRGSSTQLQLLRRMMGYSQRVLALKSGVSLRMIQQYEQRAKDINKASATNLLALAQTLGCRIEDLMDLS